MERTVEPLDKRLIKDAAAVVASAMLSNPLHLAVFERDDAASQHMQTKMFAEILKLPAGRIYVVKQDEIIVGVMNFYPPFKQMASPAKTMLLLPKLWSILGFTLFRVLRWKSAWAKHKPKTPHFHLGPLAVAPDMQGQGIGSGLLHHFCEIADAHEAPAYLETDKESNVMLYQKFGFEVMASTTLFGVTNWFMWRTAKRTRA